MSALLVSEVGKCESKEVRKCERKGAPVLASAPSFPPCLREGEREKGRKRKDVGVILMILHLN
jgi:hypothetical protein